MQSNTIWIRQLGQIQYEPVFQKMVAFTQQRNTSTPDEIWIVEHPPVFTLGQAADKIHILDPHDIPVHETDRGGEVTYHGPGQLVVYLLIDLKRRFGKLPVRELVFRIEEAIIRTLSIYGIVGVRRTGAPGIYLPAEPVYEKNQGAKIAALGLKIKSNGCMYHGFALNVAMDLEPFKWIDPCGYKGLVVTDMRSAGYSGTLKDVQISLTESLSSEMGFRAMPDDNGETVYGN